MNASISYIGGDTVKLIAALEVFPKYKKYEIIRKSIIFSLFIFIIYKYLYLNGDYYLSPIFY
ncbi:MAG: hypothetical protein Q8M44_05215 [bacterium]|nr:hypothetical protein [bacterium]